MGSAVQIPVFAWSWLIPVLPLLAFLINGLWLGRRNWKLAAGLAVLANLTAAVLAALVAQRYFAGDIDGGVVACSLEWMDFSPTLHASLGVYLDPISVMMLVVISIISTLVHVYSVGYMRHDEAAGRFFALLPFFTFAMMGLVAATNLVQLYIFWELVGVASYLLIGFWWHKPSAVAACKKAFIVTRFADAFFLVGIVLLGFTTNSFDAAWHGGDAAAGLSRTFAVGGLTFNLLSVSMILVFAGGWGKSAMFPLHIWLPDAMEGPTPVSSIIHSATMVVAGVFLTARMYPMMAASADALSVVETTGAFTALFAAVIACTQTDIKRILAFSTLSQLGYMMFSLGAAKSAEGIVGLGYTASMFHIFTHAAFKCMLFLCAGAMIHAVHSNDLAQMGGLRRKMPFTYVSALVGCLALAGIWPLSGFFSKDMILLSAYAAGHQVTFVIGLITGGLTAFYMFRMFLLAFHGEPRGDISHAHEDKFMTPPIVLLAIPSAIAGWLGEGFFERHIHPVGVAGVVHAEPVSWLPWVATGAGLLGIALAWLRYGLRVPASVFSPARLLPVRIVKNKFYIDEIWSFFAHWLMLGMVGGPARWIDKNIVDGSMDATAWVLQKMGAVQRRLQNGQTQLYLGVMLGGLLLLFLLGGFGR